MEEEKKGFVVKDRRGVEPETPQAQAAPGAMSDAGAVLDSDDFKETAKTATTANAASGLEAEAPLPTVNFVNFIISLGTTALFHLGMFPDPESNQIQQNFPAAKQTIDVIAMLQEKTKGNLSAEEAAIVEESLYNLRISYIKMTQAGSSASGQETRQEK